MKIKCIRQKAIFSVAKATQHIVGYKRFPDYWALRFIG